MFKLATPAPNGKAEYINMEYVMKVREDDNGRNQSLVTFFNGTEVEYREPPIYFIS